MPSIKEVSIAMLLLSLIPFGKLFRVTAKGSASKIINVGRFLINAFILGANKDNELANTLLSDFALRFFLAMSLSPYVYSYMPRL